MLGFRKPRPYAALEKALGYRFRAPARLELALTHRSFRHETEDVAEDNQRLEFLGDAALGLASAAHVYGERPADDEGVLTEQRSRLTSGRALAGTARRLDLGAWLRVGRGEALSGGRERESMLADAMEAVLGAAYLDGGMKAVDAIYRRHFAEVSREAVADERWGDNFKGHLQDRLQRIGRRVPAYELVAEEGPPHERRFTVAVQSGGKELGRGKGRTRRAAETAAAKAALERL